MSWFTHLMFGVLFMIGVFVLFGWPVGLLGLGLAGLGALFPDLDASESKIKHLKIPLSAKNKRHYIEPFRVFGEGLSLVLGHRGPMHSLVAVAVLGFIAFLLFNSYNQSPLFHAAFLLGYLSHLLSDALTKTGVPLFYPSKQKIRFLPQRFAIATGSVWELLFFLAGLGLFILWLSSDPGVLQDLGNLLR